MKKIYTEWNNSECFNKLLKEISRRIVLISALISCVLFLNAQTTFSSLGGVDSGGSGFKTVSANSNIVVSNVMTNDGSDMYTGVNKSQFTIKAYGVDDFTFSDLKLYYFGSTTASNTDASSTVKFYNKNDDLIQTMSLNANKEFPTSSTSLSSFFDNGTTTPISGVAYIVFDIKTVAQYNTSSYTYENITINTSPTGSAPTVTTQAVSDISTTTATGNGNVTSTGGANVTERGIYYSNTDGFADGAGTKVSATGDWSSTGAFTHAITGLSAGTTYYVKAFATNSEGTSYGSQVSFTTSAASSTCTITSNDGSTSGGIQSTTTYNLGNSFTACQDGIITSIKFLSVDARTNISLNIYSGNGTSGTLLQTVTGNDLKSATYATDYSIIDVSSYNIAVTNGSQYTFYFTDLVRGYFNASKDMNPGGTYWVYDPNEDGGTLAEITIQDLYFEIEIGEASSASSPTVTTQAVSAIAATTATGNGNITDLGGANATERGIYYSTTDGFADGAGTKVSATGDWSATGAFTQAITGLTAGTTYYVKAFATNSAGTSYGSQVNFTTDAPLCTEISTSASNGYDPTEAPLGQSFTACATGVLSEIRLLGGGAYTGKTLTIYDGEGVGGDVLGTINNVILHYGVDQADFSIIDVSSANIAVISGNKYTFYFAGANTVKLHYHDTGYEGGQAYYNGSAIPTADFYFEVDIVAGASNTAPTVTTQAVSNISATTATGNGTITDLGGADATQRGIYYSTTDGFADGTGTKVSTTGTFSSTGTFTQAITGLTAGTTYYVKAFATNSEGTSYGGVEAFTTEAEAGSSGINVLVAGAGLIGQLNAIADDLIATGLFANVDTYMTKDSTPTLEELQPYDVVLYWTYYGPANQADLGNVFVDYINQGGGLLTFPLESTTNVPLTGAFTDDYRVIVGGQAYKYNALTSFTIDLPDHPTMEGVSEIYGNNNTANRCYQADNTTLVAGSYKVASDNEGDVLLALREGVGDAGVRRAFINFLPVPSDVLNDWTIDANCDATILIANTIQWIAGGSIDGDQQNNIGEVDVITYHPAENETFLRWLRKQNGGEWVEYNTEDLVLNETYDSVSEWHYKVEYYADEVLETTDVFTVQSKYAQTITFNSLSDIGLNSSDRDPAATASSGLDVTYSSSNTNVATIVDGNIHPVATGTCTIYADQTGNENYWSATQVEQELTVVEVANDVATLTTTSITVFDATSATMGGNITDDGGATVTERGVVYSSTHTTPQIGETGVTKDSNGTGLDNFSETISGLSDGTTYYVQAYATNSEGTSYGGVESFTTAMNPPGNALDFDGIDDYVTTGADLVNFANDMTVEAWFNTTNSDSYNSIATIEKTLSGVNDFLQILTDPNGKVYIDDANDATIITTTDSYNDGRWHHVAFVRDAALKTIYLYVDGVLEGSETYTYSGATDPDHELRFGNSEYTAGGTKPNGSYLMDGMLDEIRIWNDVRTVTEIRDNLDYSLVGNEANLVAYYNFDNTAGTTLIDNNSNSYTGTLTNMTDADWVSSGAMIYAPTALAATSVTSSTATANWEIDYSAAKYYIDVSTANDFTSYVTGFENKEITGQATLSQALTGLNGSTTYYYRVRAFNGNTNQPSANSNVISFTTSTACTNPTDGGTIATAQTICYGTTPNALTSSALPTGHTGTLEYKWQSSTTSSTTGFSDIASSDSTAYAPGALTDTTWFKRLARVDCETDWTGAAESNVVEVAIGDNVSPIPSAHDTILYLNSDGFAYLTPASVDAGSTDNCGIDTMYLSQDTFDCGDIGSFVPDIVGLKSTAAPAPTSGVSVRLTVEDGSGNSAIDWFVVTVLDTISPTVSCKDTTLELDVNGQASVSAEDLGLNPKDSCGIDYMTLSTTDFSCSDIGVHKDTLTVYDVNGNSSVCISTVTVEDNINPTAIAHDTTLYLNSDGFAYLTPASVDAGSTDICGIDTMYLSQDTFDCGDIGSFVPDIVGLKSTAAPAPTSGVFVGLTVEDGSGNSAIDWFVVTVLDTISPTVLCKDTTLELDVNGQASVSAEDLGLNPKDSCGIDYMTLSTTDFSCSDIGVHKDTLTVYDVNGNSSVCISTVTVEDNINPTAIAHDTTLYLNSDGFAYLTPASVDAGSTDICGIDTMYLSQDTFDCGDIGSFAPVIVGLKSTTAPAPTSGVSVRLTVEDGSGNSAIDWFVVTVLDTISPTVSCKDTTLELDVNGQASVSAEDLGLNPKDSCGIDYMTLSTTDFSCTDIGVHKDTLTVYDVNGNSSVCISTVTVEDNINPTAIAHDTTLYLNSDGLAYLTPASVDAGSTDICGIDTMYLSQDTFDCGDIGIFAPAMVGLKSATGELPSSGVLVRLTAEDGSGNSSFDYFFVTVLDTISPTVSCKDTTLELDVNGQASVSAEDLGLNPKDSCGIDYMTLSTTDFSCSDIGVHKDTLTVYDVNGNSSVCISTVTVEDNINPTAIAHDTTLYLNSDGFAYLTPASVDAGSTDNCGIDTMYLSQDTFDCGDIGSFAPVIVGLKSTAAPAPTSGVSVRLTVEDGSGNSAIDWFVVTVLDTISPTVLCKDTTLELDVNGQASVSAEDLGLNPKDSCGIDYMTLSTTDFSCSDIGVHKDTLTVYDVNGNSSVCISTVTVEDNINPTAIAHDTTLYLNSDGLAYLTPASVDAGSTDNCGIDTMYLSQDTFDCGDIGSFVPDIVGLKSTAAPAPTSGVFVGLTVEDGSGNSAIDWFVVTVLDTISPTVLCKDTTLELDVNGQASVSAEDLGLNPKDSCGIDYMTLSTTDFSCSDISVHKDTLTVYDVNGNSSVCISTVTVEDNINPTAIAHDTTLYLNSDGFAYLTPASVDAGSTDNCGIDTMYLSQDTFDCGDIGSFAPVIVGLKSTAAPAPTSGVSVGLTVEDGSGNSAIDWFVVTVLDTVSPDAYCYKDTTIWLDELGTYRMDSIFLDSLSFDACGIDSFGLDISYFDCSNVGDTTVVMTVRDVNGNTSTCTSMVTVLDTVKPEVIIQNIIVNLDENGEASITPDTIDNGSNDACGIASMVLDSIEFDCNEVGENTVTLTVTDINGNSAIGVAVVTVEDDLPPVILADNDVTIEIIADGTATLKIEHVDEGSYDNCGIARMQLSKTKFDCSHIGKHYVRFMVTDVNGNSSYKIIRVTVIDRKAPLVSTKDTTLYLDDSGTTTLTAGDIDNGSTDNCEIHSVRIDKTVFNCSNLGANTVTLTVVDVNGNDASANATVTVMDTTSPVAVAQDIKVQLDENGTASIMAADLDNGSSDNCGVVIMRLDRYEFYCTDIGTQLLTLTVEDASGNKDSTTATVTVADTILPNVSTQDITVVLDSLGMASVTATAIDNGSGDNCSIEEMVVDKTSFACDDLGENQVVLTVTDGSGNTMTGTAIVNVVDTAPAVTLCKDFDVYLDSSGQALIDSLMLDNGSFDNCGIASITLSRTTFDCSQLGLETVIMTVTDGSGNSSSCSSKVSVLDTILPTSICKDIEVYLDSSGQALIDSSMLDNGSFDNCGIASITLSITTFDCSQLGLETVIMTVTDGSGNSSSCSSKVSVLDTILPTSICKDIEVYLDSSGQALIDSSMLDNGSFDNCGIASITLSRTTFDCSQLGLETVIMTVTDGDGNSSSCSSKVSVLDTILPTSICKDIEVYLDSSGQALIDSSMLNNGSFDNCGIASITLSRTTFDCSQLGIENVIMTVTDVSGNSSSCSSKVSVHDTILPIAICKDIEVYLDFSGQAFIDSSMFDNGSFDNCGIASISLSQTDFDCTNLGTNSTEMTVTDAIGNSSVCSSLVTVLDTLPIRIEPIEDITYELELGQCESAIEYPELKASNECAEFMLIAGLGRSALFPAGTTVETWEASYDGNKDTISFSVVVASENTAPTINQIANATANEDDMLISISLSGITGGNDCTAQDVSITASNQNAALVSDLEVVYTAGDTLGQLNLTLAANASGTDSLTVVVEDSEGAQTSVSFMLTVNPVNDAPYLLLPLPDGTVNASKTFTLPLSELMGVVFDDIDDDTLAFDVMMEGTDTLPSWAVIEGGVLTAIPMIADMGTYSFVVTATDRSGAMASDTFKVEVEGYPTAIENLDKGVFELNMYPNPTKGLVTVETSALQTSEIEIAVMNIAGAEVFRKKYQSTDPIQFNLSHQVSGIYLVLIEVEGQRVVKKLILDRK